MLKVYSVLCRPGTMDNYAYILVDEATGISAVMDPSDPAPIIAKLSELGLKPSYILNTHHHFDHTDGNIALKKAYGAKVVANQNDSARIPGFDIGVLPGESFQFGDSQAEIIDVSAHTKNHILWYFPADKIVFTGDTLFNLTIGNIFEGTDQQMFDALQIIKALPDDVKFYPGHEYTLSGAHLAIYGNNGSAEVEAYLKTAVDKLNRGEPASPVSIGIEKKVNPFLRAQTLEEFKNLG